MSAMENAQIQPHRFGYNTVECLTLCPFSLGSQLKNTTTEIPTCQPSVPIPGWVARVTTIDSASSVSGGFSRAQLPGVSRSSLH